MYVEKSEFDSFSRSVRLYDETYAKYDRIIYFYDTVLQTWAKFIHHSFVLYTMMVPSISIVNEHSVLHI